jgi:putative membrane protein
MKEAPMNILKYTLTFFYWALHSLTSVSFALAADPVSPQTYPNSWCYGRYWPSSGWIVPVMFIVLMIAIFLLIMRRRNMGSNWPDNMNQAFGHRSESAMDILNKRYAKGEIDQQEYEEKKAAISRN